MQYDPTNRRCPDPERHKHRLKQAGIESREMVWLGTKLSLLHSFYAGVRPVLLLHGVTYSAASVFDLEVPGQPRDSYSTILQLNARGLDCWALDFAGYGLSETRQYMGPETPDDYVEQVLCAAAFIRATVGQTPVLIGWSWGAQVASRAVGHSPESFAGLVFWGGFWGGTGHLDFLRQRPLPTTVRRINTPLHASADFLSSAHYKPEVKQAFVNHALWLDPTSPTTGLIHSNLHLPLHDPAKIRRPTLVTHGSNDPIINKSDMQDFLNGLRNCQVSYQPVDAADHNVQFSESRQQLFDHLASFTVSLAQHKVEEYAP